MHCDYQHVADTPDAICRSNLMSGIGNDRQECSPPFSHCLMNHQYASWQKYTTHDINSLILLNSLLNFSKPFKGDKICHENFLDKILLLCCEKVKTCKKCQADEER